MCDNERTVCAVLAIRCTPTSHLLRSLARAWSFTPYVIAIASSRGRLGGASHLPGESHERTNPLACHVWGMPRPDGLIRNGSECRRQLIAPRYGRTEVFVPGCGPKRGGKHIGGTQRRPQSPASQGLPQEACKFETYEVVAWGKPDPVQRSTEELRGGAVRATGKLSRRRYREVGALLRIR